MEITNIDQGLLITNGGYSIALILIKVLIIIVSSIFLLMGFAKVQTA